MFIKCNAAESTSRPSRDAAGGHALSRDAVHAADMCLKPGGRGEHECVVHVPQEFERRLTPPGQDDFRELEQISEAGITPK